MSDFAPHPARAMRSPVPSNSLYYRSNQHLINNGDRTSPSRTSSITSLHQQMQEQVHHQQHTQLPTHPLSPSSPGLKSSSHGEGFYHPTSRFSGASRAYDSDSVSSDGSIRQAGKYMFATATPSVTTPSSSSIDSTTSSSDGRNGHGRRLSDEDTDDSPPPPEFANTLPSVKALVTAKSSPNGNKHGKNSLLLNGMNNYAKSDFSSSNRSSADYENSLAGPVVSQTDLLEIERMRKLEQLLEDNNLRFRAHSRHVSNDEGRLMKLEQLYHSLSDIFGADAKQQQQQQQTVQQHQEHRQVTPRSAATAPTSPSLRSASAPRSMSTTFLPSAPQKQPTREQPQQPLRPQLRTSLSTGMLPRIVQPPRHSSLSTADNNVQRAQEQPTRPPHQRVSSDYARPPQQSHGNLGVERCASMSRVNRHDFASLQSIGEGISRDRFPHSSSVGKSSDQAPSPLPASSANSSMPGSVYELAITPSDRSTAPSSVVDPLETEIKPLASLRPQDIAFRVATLPEKRLTDQDGRNIVAENFPKMCEAPARMFGEDGAPLPPTKKEEITQAERDARKNALQITYRGKQKHSLMKAMVIMESRNATWKRVGPSTRRLSSLASSSSSANAHVQPLPETPNPWSLEIYHQDLDFLRNQGKSKRRIELPESRTEGQCPKCCGNGLDMCATCNGAPADECWWCAGSGMRKGTHHKCARCQGAGTLKCDACRGTLVSPCKSCDGQGHGQYAVTIEIKVRRIDFPPFPVSSLIPNSHLRASPEAIRSAAITRTWALIQKLTESCNAKSTVSYLPVSASCGWETSVSHLVQVDVPLAARLLKKKGSEPSLRATSLHRKIHTAKHYFIIPSDPDLRPAELTPEEFEDALMLEKAAFNERDDLPAAYHTDDLPSPRSSEIMTPVRNQFRIQPSPYQQLAQTPASSRPGTPVMARPGTPKFADTPQWNSGAATPVASDVPFGMPTGINAKQFYNQQANHMEHQSKSTLTKTLFRSKSMSRLHGRSSSKTVNNAF